MGAYRLLLAALVLVSHTDKPFLGYNVGVFAVISFFIISGYVMTALIDKRYLSPFDINGFYIDRALRLFPQFIFYILLTGAIMRFGLQGTPYGDAATVSNIATALTMLPLGYYMFGAMDINLIPPAWSLGLELTFYAIFPFILLFRSREISFSLSIIVFVAACTTIIDTDTYAYRLIPGTLFMFLCGSFMYRPSKQLAHALPIITGASAALLVAILYGVVDKGHHAVEVLAGLVFGIPAVFAIKKLGNHKIDEFLGNLSYGVFLNHFAIICIAYSLGKQSFSWADTLLVLASSMILSLATYYAIERPALKFRHMLRKKHAPSHAVQGN